jgi:signal transduction histidine kinase
MSVFSSLTNRIFFASALLAVLAIAVAVYRVNVAVTAQAENELTRGLEEAGALVAEYRATQFEHFAREARLVADLPTFKATVELNDPPTTQPIAEEYQHQLAADLVVVTNRTGQVLAEAGRLRVPQDSPEVKAAVDHASTGADAASLWPHPGGVIQVVTVPSIVTGDLVGTLSVGFSLDEQAAARFKTLTNSDVAFVLGREVQASTLPARFNDSLVGLVGAVGVRRATLGDSEYVAMSRPLTLPRPATPADPAGDVTALVLRSRTERLRFLSDVHRELAVTAVLAVLAATLLSYGVARTVTRPLGTITATMREMAATGDLTRRIPLGTESRWDDEDAQLLARTFNSMTGSIARFQREAGQRERLSSLGRLSTVVAHEIRNPLMIIKTALRTLRRDQATSAEVRTAVADIDEEIARLNRIVSEVLDFARPIKFDIAPADVNALCAEAARATAEGDSAIGVRLDLDPALPAAPTDGERLRLALVNILANARHAIAARKDPPPGPDPIRVTTAARGSRLVIGVTDRGPGIAPDDLPRVFDPYFTTRRTGTGLGLAISRNIIEGLGGTIAISSQLGQGTEVRIDLPLG